MVRKKYLRITLNRTKKSRLKIKIENEEKRKIKNLLKQYTK
jgi:hypothetical protein